MLGHRRTERTGKVTEGQSEQAARRTTLELLHCYLGVIRKSSQADLRHLRLAAGTGHKASLSVIAACSFSLMGSERLSTQRALRTLRLTEMT